MPPLLPKNRSVDERAHLDKSRTEISRNRRKLAIFPLCAAPFSLCVTLLWGLFWGTCRCPKCAQVGLFKILSWLFSNTIKFLNLVLICPYTSPFSQDCFLCVKKVAERPFLGVFWPLGDPKLVKISCPDTNRRIFWCWIQIWKWFLDWSAIILASRQWRGTQGEISCFVLKKFACDQNLPKFFGIWAGGSLWSALLC